VYRLYSTKTYYNLVHGNFNFDLQITRNEGDFPFGYAVFRRGRETVRSTQYAKGRCAVRKKSVISYADINFYFKIVQFLS